MAVPRYGAPKQQLNALPQTRVTPHADETTFGGGPGLEKVGDTMRRTADTAMKVVAQERENADQLAVQDADLKAAELQTSIALSAKNYKGKEAAKYIDYSNDAWTKGIDKIRGELTSERQRIKFDRLSQVRWQDVNKTSQVYMGKELEQYDRDNTTAYVKNAQDQLATLIATGNVPDVYEQSGLAITQQEESIKAFARRNGEAPELTKQKLIESRSDTHTAVVNQLMSMGDPKGAQMYFNDFRKEIVGKNAKALADTVKKQAILYDANEKSKEIMLETTSPEEALAAVQKIKDPEMKEAVQKRVYTVLKVADNLEKKKNEQIKKAYDQEVFKTATDFTAGKLTIEDIDAKVAAGKLKPEDADAFQIALASPQEWSRIEGDPKQQAEAGIYFINAINGLKKGDDASGIITNAVKQYVDGGIDGTDLGWVLKAAQFRNDPQSRPFWNKFLATLPSVMSNLGPSGAFNFVRTWDFKTDPQEHYKQLLQNALAGPVGVDQPPRYLVNAFGFMRKLFDGETSTTAQSEEGKDASAGNKPKPE